MAADDTVSMGVAPQSMLSRLVRFGARQHTVPLAIEPLVSALWSNHPKAEIGLILKAYEVAEKAHEGQTRRSGDPYITHPVSVATILAELGLMPTTLAAALLHDTVEDTSYTLEEAKRDFGEEIAKLIDGVTKLDKVKYGAAAQAETVRKMIVAMSKDVRVLLIKLADRLHNARTWKYVSGESAARKARETLEIYAPLAHRLGVNAIKWELEDLSFQVLFPKVYDEIVHLVSERAPARETYLSTIRQQIEADLREAGIANTVTGRPKHYYSIYQKMIVRGREFDDIYDLVGVRVLVESVRDCYGALGAMHARWKPLPGRFKDYIATPKFNMYQSLHTTVLGPGGRPVEIQIRTYDMHERAEYGVAAHWKYKDDPNRSRKASSNEMQEFGWMRQLVDWQMETSDPAEFLDSLLYEMAGDQVYVYTPKGDVIELAGGATPVDFAYSVHTEVGHHTVGARVNGKLVPLSSRLNNGDTVEVFTSKAEGAGPSRDWLSFVATARARNKIKSWFTRERREEAIEAGKAHLAKAMRKQNLPIQRLMNHESLTGLADEMRYGDVAGLYAAIGENHVSASNVVQRLVRMVGGDAGAEEDLAEATIPGAPSKRHTSDPGIVLDGVNSSDTWVKIARCCTPVPGDEIVGFVTRGSGISVHRTDCGNIEQLKLEPERMVPVAWSAQGSGVFLVQVQIGALDRAGLLSDITKILSENHVNILSASSTTTRDRVATLRFTFEMGDTEHLDHLLAAVRRIDGVFEAFRVTGTKRRKNSKG